MDNYRAPRMRGSQQRRKVRWNYKRIAFALVILLLIAFSAAYGGYSLAHKLSVSNSQKEEVSANKPTQVKAQTTTKLPPTTTTTKQQYIEYEVKAGDTFYGLAIKFGTSVDALKKLNGVAGDDDNLQIGQILKIPAKGVLTAQTSDEETTQLVQSNSKRSIIKASSQEISRGPTNVKKIALTFDVGADSKPAPKILQALDDAGVGATFFLTGKWVEENPQLTKDIANRGFLIGNHTYAHPDLTKETEDNIAYELSETERLVKEATGETTKPLFRPPFGSRDKRVLRIVAEQGYRSIYWTIDSLDWKPTMTPEQVKNRVIAGLSNGAIILMHCGSPQTAQILPELIDEIKNRGYEIVSVPELFE